jgi:hypothetical protein
MESISWPRAWQPEAGRRKPVAEAGKKTSTTPGHSRQLDSDEGSPVKDPSSGRLQA